MRRSLCLSFALLPVVLSASSQTAPWDAGLNFDFGAASIEFTRLHTARPTDARLALAHAGTLIGRQPRTESNIVRARAVLVEVLERGDVLAPEDHALAVYLRARIDQDHLATPDLVAARAGYETLRREHPDHPLAGHAAIHLALIALYQSPGKEMAETLSTLDALLTSVTQPSARRELLHLIGRLHWDDRGDAAAALPFLIAGRELGYESPARNGEVDLLIADLATQAGRPALAVRHYLAFANAQPRDPRSSTARRFAADQEALAAARSVTNP